jgi:hypothetical protein
VLIESEAYVMFAPRFEGVHPEALDVWATCERKPAPELTPQTCPLPSSRFFKEKMSVY